MSSKPGTVNKKVIGAIEGVLKARMGRFGFKRASVRAGEDHDGDPVLRTDAEYTYSEKPIDVRATVGLTTELRDALEKVGEYRFPYIRHHFDERQQTAKYA
jgi:hypothetical protein